MKKIICIVGMAGAGKSLVSDELVKQGYKFLRFGQITLDKVKERGLKPVEANEKKIREEIRKKHGMGAFALLNIPKLDDLLKKSNVVVDGLYSWSEYKVLKEKYGDLMSVVAVFAPPEMRYETMFTSWILPDALNLYRDNYIDIRASLTIIIELTPLIGIVVYNVI